MKSTVLVQPHVRGGVQEAELTCPYCGSLFRLDSLDEGLVAAYCKPDIVLGCRKCLNVYKFDRAAEEYPSGLPNWPLVQNLAQPGSVMAEIFARLPEFIENLPVPPEIPQKVISQVHDPLSSMKEIAKVVEDDPGFSFRLLQLANSAAYVSRSEITNVATACTRLGPRVLLNVAYMLSQKNAYRSKAPQFSNLVDRIWQHSVATAHLSQVLSDLVFETRSSLLFLAGLTHDIGKLVLTNAISTGNLARTGVLADSEEVLLRVVAKFGPLISLHVAQHWKLHPLVGTISLFVDSPESAISSRVGKGAHLVTLASDIADALGFGVERAESDDSLTPDALLGHPSTLALGLESTMTDDLVQTLRDETRSMVELLSRD